MGGVLLAIIVVLIVLAPWIAPFDPMEIDPIMRLRPPSTENLFGTDALGRDILSRVLWGGRVSLFVGFTVAVAATGIGLSIGLLAGYLRRGDEVIMRVMDGLMAVPGILLAIVLMTLTRGSITAVVIAITVPEVPRVVRLARSLVLSVRNQTYVEAAVAMGTSEPRILVRHILPNVAAPLIVQATFVMASAIMIEAYLGFLGIGTPPEIPSWGNMMAEARSTISIGLWAMLFPGIMLALTVLAINLCGDRLRDILDPRLARRI
ncbi:ABC transporter permease [Ferrovibrio sp.]|uniref:ABC transporter permease n=1 Tax=Ferrovibrio sp. TaxID=1917215 RepID=UPI00260B211B|nr:ABC transporter permease [Ferrovibrio sp.]